MKTTRCKFECRVVTKRVGQSGKPLFEAEFEAVAGGSPENDSFFQYTPNANLKLAVYSDDLFEPGKEYYIDITEVDAQFSTRYAT